MTWRNIFSGTVQPDQWYLTEPINNGAYFKVANNSPQFEFKGKIAQAGITEQGKLQLYEQQLLRIRNSEEYFRFDRPSFLLNRNIAVNISNTAFVPLELWQCNLEISVYESLDIPLPEGRVDISQVTLTPSLMFPLLGAEANRRGHIVENIGDYACVVYYSLSDQFVLYSRLIMPTQQYYWDYPEIYPYKGYSTQGTTLRIYDIY